MRQFDRKFGADFIAKLPGSPGVYRMFNSEGTLIYVGKAKNLRRRLSQYRNAKRVKRDRRMRAILAKSERIEWEVCASELDAILLETRLIQQFRPRWNIVGAFSFLYPTIGMGENFGGSEGFSICLTTVPERLLEHFGGYRFHGAYRSREITGEAFFSLMKLLKFIGHPMPRKRLGSVDLVDYSYVFGFRKISKEWIQWMDLFFKGESLKLMEELILALVENAAARKNAEEIQEQINALRRFWKHEARILFKVRRATQCAEYPINQKERDLLFLRYRAVRGQISTLSEDLRHHISR